MKYQIKVRFPNGIPDEYICCFRANDWGLNIKKHSYITSLPCIRHLFKDVKSYYGMRMGGLAYKPYINEI